MTKKNKKKVLVIANNDLGIGGIQTVIINIIRFLSDDFQFDVVVFDHTHTDYEKEILTQGKIFTVPNRLTGNGLRKKVDYYIRFLRNYKKIRRIIKENGPYQAIHCHNFYESAISLLAAKQEKIDRRIVHSHSVLYVNKRKYIRRLYQFIYRKIMLQSATDLVACSEIAGKYLYGERNDVKVIPNGIDLQKFSKASKSCKNAWSFIQVGRWGTVKNQIFTMEVFAEIHKNHSNAKMTFIGGGDEEYLKKLKKMAKEYGLEDVVTYLPENADVPAVMAEHNTLIFPSEFEGLGIVVIEAQALGLNCFVSTGVPKEVNLGNVVFIDLNLGPLEWARQIQNQITIVGAERHYVDMSKYDMNNVKETYRILYGGN